MLLEVEILGLTDCDKLRETLVEADVLGLTDCKTHFVMYCLERRNTWADRL